MQKIRTSLQVEVDKDLDYNGKKGINVARGVNDSDICTVGQAKEMGGTVYRNFIKTEHNDVYIHVGDTLTEIYNSSDVILQDISASEDIVNLKLIIHIYLIIVLVV